jgi:phytoene dehydrogenase-like protein
MDNGDYLAAWDDHDLTRRELYRHSPRDAEATDEYSRVMARAAKAIKPVIGLVPPDPSSLSWRDLRGLLKLGQYGASLSESEIYRIAKLVTQSSADLLDEWFEFDPLKGTKSASGIIGTFLGPRSPGTDSPRTAPAESARRSRVPRARSASRSAPARPSKRWSCAAAAQPAWHSRTATSCTRKS